MKTHQKRLEIRTRAKAFHNISGEIEGCVANSGVSTGLCHVFVQHTSASLVIQENADPAVRRDLERWFSEVVPEARNWEHSAEGPDDMPSHVRSVLTSTSETVPVTDGRLALGTWQGVYLWEHRDHPHVRCVTVTVSGD